MEVLRVGSLNINGGRDECKRALVFETIEEKKLNVIFLKKRIAILLMNLSGDYGGKGQYILSHKTNVSAGLAILFSPDLRVTVLKKEEPVNGRLAVVKADIDGALFTL